MNTALFTHALGWSLIHSLWQGLLIGGFVFAAVSATTKSERKYTFHCVGLLALLLSFAGTFFWEARPVPTLEVSTTVTSTVTTVESQPIPAAVSTLATSHAQSSSQINWDKLAASLTWLWFMGVTAMTLRAAFAAGHVHALRKTSIPVRDELWQTKLNSWSAQLGIRKIVTLATTTLNDVPATIGHFKPLILLPAAILTRLTPEQIEALILHELAHIRRHDYLINALQIAAETLLFFHPIAWWLSRSIRHQRELCCDQIVAERSSDRATYAKALLTLEELRVHSPSVFALAATDGPLKKRIARVLHPESSQVRPSGWTAALIILTLVAVLAFSAWPKSHAQQSSPPSQFQVRLVTTNREGAEELPLVNGQPGVTQKLLVAKETIIDASHVKSAEAIDDPLGNHPQVQLTLDNEGAARFAKVTRENVGNQLAIVVNGQILSAPVIRQEIPGGSIVISGNLNHEEAADLAKKLNPATKSNGSNSTSIRLEGQVFEMKEDPAQHFALKNKIDSGSSDVTLWDLTDDEARALIEQAKTSANVTTLASPILNTVSGRAARIEIGDVPNPKGTFSVNAKGYVLNNQPASQSEPALIGQSLELLPELSNDHFIIAGKFIHRQKLSADDSAPIQTIYSTPIYAAISKGHSIALVQRNKQTARFSNQLRPPPPAPTTLSGTVKTNSAELITAQEELKRLKGLYTDLHPDVQRQQQIVEALHAGNASTNAQAGYVGQGQSMMYYMQNPELMKRYFPQLYQQLQNGGVNKHLLLIISPKVQE